MGKKETATEGIEQVYRELDQALDSFTEQELLKPSSNPGWSAQDTLAHLTTIEERTRGQINVCLTGGDWNPAEDIDTYNERQVAARRGQSVKQLRDELTKQHQETLALLRGAQETDFDKEYTHPRRGRITLGRRDFGLLTAPHKPRHDHRRQNTDDDDD